MVDAENQLQDFRGCSEGTHFAAGETEVQGSYHFCPQICKAGDTGV